MDLLTLGAFDQRQDILTRPLFGLQQRGKDEWMAKRSKALDYYTGDVDDYTKSYFPIEWNEKIPFSNNNLTRNIVDEISLVYSQPALRSVENDKYSASTKNKNRDLMRSERMLNLLNFIVLKVGFVEDKFTYKPMQDFEIEVTHSGRVNKISFPLTRNSSTLNAEGDVWEEWTEDTITTFVRGYTVKVLSVEENELHIMPFVCVKTMEGRHSFTDISPAMDIVSMNEAVNVATANMWANIHFQSFNTNYIIGSLGLQEGELPPKIGPDQTLVLDVAPDSVEIGQLTSNDSVSSINDAIKEQTKAVSNNYHLSAGFLDNTQAESGIALKVRNQSLLDFRSESVTLWKTVEEDIYEIERVMLQAFEGVSLPEEFSVDFQEKNSVLTTQEQEAQDKWYLELGITTAAQIMVRTNPDLTEEEAQKKIDDNKAANAGVVEETIDLNTILQG